MGPVLRACLDSLESEVIDHGVRLVLVDSVAAPVKRAFGPGEGRERQEALGLVGSRLKWLADVFRLPVAVTNHTAGTFLREAGDGGGGGAPRRRRRGGRGGDGGRARRRARGRFRAP